MAASSPQFSSLSVCFPTCRVKHKLEQATFQHKFLWNWWSAAGKYLWDPLLFISLKPELSPPQGHALLLTLSWWNKVNAEVSLPCTFHPPRNQCHVQASEHRPRLAGRIIICLSSHSMERTWFYWCGSQLALIRYLLPNRVERFSRTGWFLSCGGGELSASTIEAGEGCTCYLNAFKIFGGFISAGCGVRAVPRVLWTSTPPSIQPQTFILLHSSVVGEVK